MKRNGLAATRYALSPRRPNFSGYFHVQLRKALAAFLPLLHQFTTQAEHLAGGQTTVSIVKPLSPPRRCSYTSSSS